MNVDGACHCGKIAYEAEIDPATVQICHCRDCQTLTGSAFRVAVPALPEHFRLIRGTPKIYLKTADSGSQRRHAFCGDCGAPVYRMPTDNTPTYALRVGGLRQAAALPPPRRQIWTKRRLAWVTKISDIPDLDAQSR
ncbi:MAG: GFA family protein [Henriciella sp.]|nr:GFA family protein [Henriciella sp.]